MNRTKSRIALVPRITEMFQKPLNIDAEFQEHPLKCWVVTGGAGFIGSHVVDCLLKEGDQVVVVDDLSTGSVCNVPSTLRTCSSIWNRVELVDPLSLPDTIDGIIHLAARPNVSESWLDPIDAHSRTCTSTLQVIEWARAKSVPRIVFASSSAIYGAVEKEQISEATPASPTSPYGMQKWMSEEYLKLFCSRYNFTNVSLRFFNVYGPRQLPSSPYSGVISLFSNQMMNNKDIIVYGDGLQSRDFIHVEDVAKAIVVALKSSTFAQCTNHVFNLGTGNARTILQLIEVMRSVFPQWSGRVCHSEPRIGDIRSSCADISAARATGLLKELANLEDKLICQFR